jgi:hypothetical protein
MATSTRRTLKALLFGGLCMAGGFLATALLANSSTLTRAAAAGVGAGLIAAVLLNVPWMRS